jgi:predicted esterase
MHGQARVDSFVLWTGRPPAEENEQLLDRLPRERMVCVYANEDQFLAVEKARLEAQQLQQRYPQLQLLEQAGGHDILPETLEEVAKIILK